MAIDTKKALADIIQLRKDFENDAIYTHPKETAERLTAIMSVMTPSTKEAQDVLDAQQDPETILEFFKEVQKISTIAKSVNIDSIKAFKKQEISQKKA